MPSHHHHRQVELFERTRQPLVQLRLAQRHPAPRHRALRCRSRLFEIGQRLQGATRSGAWTHPGGDGCHRRHVQRVRVASPGERGQLQLAALKAACPWLDDGDALATQYDPGSGRSPAHGLPAFTHRPKNACCTSRSTPCTFRDSCTWAAGIARSAGFVRDFISVLPFDAC